MTGCQRVARGKFSLPQDISTSTSSQPGKDLRAHPSPEQACRVSGIKCDIERTDSAVIVSIRPAGTMHAEQKLSSVVWGRIRPSIRKLSNASVVPFGTLKVDLPTSGEPGYDLTGSANRGAVRTERAE